MLKVSKYAFVLESFLLKLKAYSVGEDLPKAIRILEQPQRTFFVQLLLTLNSFFLSTSSISPTITCPNSTIETL